MEIEHCLISQIRFKTKERVRRDLSGIDELAASIKQYGLLHPILVSSDYKLIAGHRRILAFQKLGYNKIPTLILPYQLTPLEKLSLETEENVRRKNFTSKELAIFHKKKSRYKAPLWKKILLYPVFLLGSFFSLFRKNKG